MHFCPQEAALLALAVGSASTAAAFVRYRWALLRAAVARAIWRGAP